MTVNVRTAARRQSLAPHSHPVWELTLALEGEGVYRIGEREIPFSPGTVLLLPPGTVHEACAPDGFSDMSLTFSEAPTRETAAIVAQDDEFTTLRRTLELIDDIERRNGEGSRGACADLAAVLIGLVNARRRESAIDPCALEIRRRILASFSDPAFQIATAMEGLPFCTDYLRRLFSAAFGLSPQRYLTSLRMEKARRMLAEGGTPIAEVALASGYEDPSYFARIFRLENGIGPAAYATEKRSVLSD